MKLYALPGATGADPLWHDVCGPQTEGLTPTGAPLSPVWIGLALRWSDAFPNWVTRAETRSYAGPEGFEPPTTRFGDERSSTELETYVVTLGYLPVACPSARRLRL
jgi:hypothetical protein